MFRRRASTSLPTERPYRRSCHSRSMPAPRRLRRPSKTSSCFGIPSIAVLGSPGRSQLLYFLSDCERACIKIRSEEHTSELQSLMRISYAVFCLKKKNQQQITVKYHNTQCRYYLHDDD